MALRRSRGEGKGGGGRGEGLRRPGLRWSRHKAQTFKRKPLGIENNIIKKCYFFSRW